MQGYRDSGEWEKIKSVKKDIWEVATSDTLKDMWIDLSGNQFIVPNPIPSMRILMQDTIPCFNFILNKDTTKRHQLQKHIVSAPKPIDKEKEDFDRAYVQYVREGTEEDILYDDWNNEQERQADMDSQDPF